MKKVLSIFILSSAIYAGDLFLSGHKNFNVSVGTSSSYGNTYTVVGINANYFIVNNLSVGVGYRGWFGDKPNINEITIPITLYASMRGYNPYVGIVLNHTMMDDPYEDYSVYGGRMGIALQSSSNSFMSIGWVYEYREDASGNTISKSYPEVNIGFSF